MNSTQNLVSSQWISYCMNDTVKQIIYFWQRLPYRRWSTENWPAATQLKAELAFRSNLALFLTITHLWYLICGKWQKLLFWKVSLIHSLRPREYFAPCQLVARVCHKLKTAEWMGVQMKRLAMWKKKIWASALDKLLQAFIYIINFNIKINPAFKNVAMPPQKSFKLTKRDL